MEEEEIEAEEEELELDELVSFTLVVSNDLLLTSLLSSLLFDLVGLLPAFGFA